MSQNTSKVVLCLVCSLAGSKSLFQTPMFLSRLVPLSLHKNFKIHKSRNKSTCSSLPLKKHIPNIPGSSSLDQNLGHVFLYPKSGYYEQCLSRSPLLSKTTSGWRHVCSGAFFSWNKDTEKFLSVSQLSLFSVKIWEKEYHGALPSVLTLYLQVCSKSRSLLRIPRVSVSPK